MTTDPLTCRQASFLLGVSVDTVFRLIHSGRLAATTVPRHTPGRAAYAIDRASAQALKATLPRRPDRQQQRPAPAPGTAYNRVARLVATGSCAGHTGLAAAVIALAMDDAPRRPEAADWLATTGAYWLELLGKDAA